MSKAIEFRNLMLAQLGEAYVYGAEVSLSDPNPAGPWDCSELGQWAFARIGFTVPDGARYQYRLSTALPSNAVLKVGDAAFWMNVLGTVTHVAYHIGRGQVIEARGSKYGVVLTTVAAVNARDGKWRRFPYSLGSLTPDRTFRLGLFHADTAKTNRIVALCKEIGVAVVDEPTAQETYKYLGEYIRRIP